MRSRVPERVARWSPLRSGRGPRMPPTARRRPPASRRSGYAWFGLGQRRGAGASSEAAHLSEIGGSIVVVELQPPVAELNLVPVQVSDSEDSPLARAFE